MKLKEIDPRTKVKVGMVDGSCFVYAGEFGGMDFDKATAADYDATWEAFISIMRTVKAETKHTKKNLKLLLKRAEGVQNFLPVEEREILDSFESSTDDALTVIIPGYTNGRHWLLDETPKPVNVKNTEAAIELVGRIYRSLKDELISLYLDYLKTRSIEAAALIYKDQRDIRANEYGAIQDPEYFIEFCRREAVKQKCYIGGRLVYQPEMLMEILEEL